MGEPRVNSRNLEMQKAGSREAGSTPIKSLALRGPNCSGTSGCPVPWLVRCALSFLLDSPSLGSRRR